MSGSGKLKIGMFGGFSLTYNDGVLSDVGSRSPKILNLLAYLITYRQRDISQNELVDFLWSDEDIQDPTGALKTIVYRARMMLGELGLDGKKLILPRRGAYTWGGGEIETRIDTEEFENLCGVAEKMRFDKASLPTLLEAAKLYKGDLLPDLSSETWVIPLSAYYNSRYVKIVSAASGLLLEDERYEDVLKICKDAISLSPYDEPLNAYFIQALIKLGRYRLALNHYQQVVDMLYQQFAVAPSEEFTDLYREIVSQTHIVESCISDISNKIQEKSPESGAYYCEPAIFEEICRYDARTKIRSGGVAFLALLTVRGRNDELPEASALEKAAKMLHETIHHSLRSGDCFTQINKSQFTVLLQNTTYEKGLMVMMRVVYAYQRRNPGSGVKAVYNLEQLNPTMTPERK